MTGELTHIVRCLDLQERDIAAAVASRERTLALLAHLAAVSAPDTGVAKVLLVLARMATTSCDWIDGDLLLELIATGDATRVEAATELGGGLRERVLPSLVFRAPLDEFTRAVARVSHMIAPLRVRAGNAQRIALGASEAARRTSMPPPIEISADSLFLHPPPQVVAAAAADRAAPPELLRAVTDATSTTDDVDAGWD